MCFICKTPIPARTPNFVALARGAQLTTIVPWYKQSKQVAKLIALCLLALGGITAIGLYAHHSLSEKRHEAELRQLQETYNAFLSAAKKAIQSEKLEIAIDNLKQAVAMSDTVNKSEATMLLPETEMVIATPYDQIVGAMSDKDLMILQGTRMIANGYQPTDPSLNALYLKHLLTAATKEHITRQSKAEAERKKKEMADLTEARRQEQITKQAEETRQMELAQNTQVAREKALANGEQDWLQLADRRGVHISGRITACDGNNITLVFGNPQVSKAYPLNQIEDINFAGVDANLMRYVAWAGLTSGNGVVAYKVASLGKVADTQLNAIALEPNFASFAQQVLTLRPQLYDLYRKLRGEQGRINQYYNVIATATSSLQRERNPVVFSQLQTQINDAQSSINNIQAHIGNVQAQINSIQPSIDRCVGALSSLCPAMIQKVFPSAPPSPPPLQRAPESATLANPETVAEKPHLSVHDLNDINSWTVISGSWTKMGEEIIGKGDGVLDLTQSLPINVAIEFCINVKEGFPRVWFQDNSFWFGNESDEKSFYLYGPGITNVSGKHLLYANNQQYYVMIRLVGESVTLIVDGETKAKGKRSKLSPVRLRIQGGDGRGKGTTSFSNFSVSETTP